MVLVTFFVIIFLTLANSRHENLLPTPSFTKYIKHHEQHHYNLFVRGVCDKANCDTSIINAELYIEDKLYLLVERFLNETNVTMGIENVINQRIGEEKPQTL